MGNVTCFSQRNGCRSTSSAGKLSKASQVPTSTLHGLLPQVLSSWFPESEGTRSPRNQAGCSYMQHEQEIPEAWGLLVTSRLSLKLFTCLIQSTFLEDRECLCFVRHIHSLVLGGQEKRINVCWVTEWLDEDRQWRASILCYGTCTAGKCFLPEQKPDPLTHPWQVIVLALGLI